MTSKRELEAQRTREAEAAGEAGADYFRTNPEAMLIEAWHEAARLYGLNARHQLLAFYWAVRAAREQRDEYYRELKA
jgi:hypothetical protein